MPNVPQANFCPPTVFGSAPFFLIMNLNHFYEENLLLTVAFKNEDTAILIRFHY